MYNLISSLILIVFWFSVTSAYFTLPGKCPEKVDLKDDFRLADFYGKWHQVYHYSSDNQHLSNCTTLELETRSSGIYLNISRVDRGLFHRFSVARVEIPIDIEKASELDLTFVFRDAPRRLMNRRYPFRVLATNYNYYATVYTCSYSPLIDKHFIYVWILSRNPTLNVVSKELAIKPLQQIGVDAAKLFQDEREKCNPKYYEDKETEPLTFRMPVPITV